MTILGDRRSGEREGSVDRRSSNRVLFVVSANHERFYQDLIKQIEVDPAITLRPIPLGGICGSTALEDSREQPRILEHIMEHEINPASLVLFDLRTDHDRVWHTVQILKHQLNLHSLLICPQKLDSVIRADILEDEGLRHQIRERGGKVPAARYSIFPHDSDPMLCADILRCLRSHEAKYRQTPVSLKL